MGVNRTLEIEKTASSNINSRKPINILVTKHHINAPVNSQDYKHQWWEDVAPRADLHTVTLKTNIIFLWKVRTIIRILHATFPACHCNISLDQQKIKLAVKIFFLSSTVQFFFNSQFLMLLNGWFHLKITRGSNCRST